jgi:hypothetical protein
MDQAVDHLAQAAAMDLVEASDLASDVKEDLVGPAVDLAQVAMEASVDQMVVSVVEVMEVMEALVLVEVLDPVDMDQVEALGLDLLVEAEKAVLEEAMVDLAPQEDMDREVLEDLTVDSNPVVTEASVDLVVMEALVHHPEVMDLEVKVDLGVPEIKDLVKRDHGDLEIKEQIKVDHGDLVEKDHLGTITSGLKYI